MEKDTCIFAVLLELNAFGRGNGFADSGKKSNSVEIFSFNIFSEWNIWKLGLSVDSETFTFYFILLVVQFFKSEKVIKYFHFLSGFHLNQSIFFCTTVTKKNNQNPNMENIQPFGFIEDPMEINLKTFNNLYFPPYHKPMCVINQILKVFLFSVFDLSVQLRERPNQDIFFLLHWACFVRWNYLLAYFFIWNWLSKHGWIMRIKWKKHWKIMGWWEQEVPCVSCISCK